MSIGQGSNTTRVVEAETREECAAHVQAFLDSDEAKRLGAVYVPHRK